MESPAARRMSLSFLSVEQPRWLAAVASLVLFCGVCPAMSDPGPEIESKGRRALADLVAHDQRTRALVERAAGILVMPDMVEMAFGVGGEYGEGVLLVDDKAVAYYAFAAAPLRLEPRPKNKAHVLVFLTRQALIDFRNTQGWEVGIHGNVPLLDHTVELPVETSATADTTVGFLFTEQGLLSGFDLSGGRFSRIAR
jgi:lipid-binding SYLF domain-containing protein